MTNKIKNPNVAVKSGQKGHRTPVQIIANSVQIMFVTTKLDQWQMRGAASFQESKSVQAPLVCFTAPDLRHRHRVVRSLVRSLERATARQ
jgi:hypothetical protein